MNNIKTRFAPSPTGKLHIGGVRTALYSWLYSRRYNGKFLLRIDDTDHNRFMKSSIDTIINGIKWLNLNWDDGPFYQSQRIQRYNSIINQMLSQGIAYRCYCSKRRLELLRKTQLSNKQKPRYDGFCRNNNNFDESKLYVVRFSNPLKGNVIFKDEIRGWIKINNTELDDLVIKRNNGIPTYNFCTAIDDWDMKITHVIRGEEHINNTPRQINILTALGAPIPIYAHVPTILGNDGKKISKRHGATDVIEYLNNGYLPEAILNYLIRLGWSYGNQEIFSCSEMIKLFSLKAIHRSSSIFAIHKLQWYNHYYLNSLSPKYIAKYLIRYMKEENIDINSGPDLIKLIELLRSRCKTLKELAQLSYYFYNDFDLLNNNKITKKYFLSVVYLPLKTLLNKLSDLSIWSSKHIQEIIDLITKKYSINLGQICMPLRIALIGLENSPNIYEVIHILGKKCVLKRIKSAIFYIENINKQY